MSDNSRSRGRLLSHPTINGERHTLVDIGQTKVWWVTCSCGATFPSVTDLERHGLKERQR